MFRKKLKDNFVIVRLLQSVVAVVVSSVVAVVVSSVVAAAVVVSSVVAVVVAASSLLWERSLEKCQIKWIDLKPFSSNNNASNFVENDLL